MAQIQINPSDLIGTIQPTRYGHFTEHLGRCIYDGVWVGEDSPIPNTNGFRNDVIEALRRLKSPVVRWPGGCFADDYHWQDGIGPRAQRPRRINIHWGEVIETNQVDTHEFIQFCRLIGAEPFGHFQPPRGQGGDGQHRTDRQCAAIHATHRGQPDALTPQPFMMKASGTSWTVTLPPACVLSADIDVA